MNVYKKILLLSLFSPLILWGCEKKQGPVTNPDGSLADSGIQTELTLWTDEEDDFFTAVGREFLTALADPTVSFDVVEFESAEVLHDFLLESLAEGTGPDLIYTSGSWVHNNTGKLLPRLGDEGFRPDGFRQTFVRSASESLIVDEEIYGVPLGVDSLALFYNEEHVLDRLPNRNTPGKTWDQIQNDAEALSVTDNSFERFATAGLALGRLDNILHGYAVLENLMLQSNVSFLTPDGKDVAFHQTVSSRDGRPLNLGDDVLNFFTSFADARFKHVSWSNFLAQPESKHKDLESFMRGKVSMVFGYSHDWETLEDIRENLKSARQKTVASDNIRVAFFPQAQGVEFGETRKVIGEVHALAVPRSTSSSDLSWRFMKFMVRKENMQAFFDETLLPTPRVDMLVEQEGHPQVGLFVRQAKFARAQNLSPALDRMHLKQGFESLVASINDGKISINKGLQALGIRASKEVKDYWKMHSKLNKDN